MALIKALTKALAKKVAKVKKALYKAFADYRVTVYNDDGSVFSVHYAYTHKDAVEWVEAQMSDMLTVLDGAALTHKFIFGYGHALQLAK